MVGIDEVVHDKCIYYQHHWLALFQDLPTLLSLDLTRWSRFHCREADCGGLYHHAAVRSLTRVRIGATVEGSLSHFRQRLRGRLTAPYLWRWWQEVK